MKRTLGIALIGIMAGLLCINGQATSWSEEGSGIHKEDGKVCRVCGMNIERFKKTAVYVDYKDGFSKAYCGVSCAIRAINERGGLSSVQSARVTGWGSQIQAEMQSAAYVIGSKLIPDMIPNIIAFESRDAAESFIRDQGGRIETLDSLMVTTSYRGLTAPFRIPSAAVPSQGVFMVADGVSTKHMDHLLEGHTDRNDGEAFRTRTTIPHKMTTIMAMQGFGYGVTDDVFVQLSMPYIWKSMKSEMRNGRSVDTHTQGLGDAAITGRWRFWHDPYFDKHLGVLGAVSLPTGNYDSSRRSMPGMQIGSGAPSYTTGLLYSQHVGPLWVHLAGTYKYNVENSDDYKFGDTINAGLAVHYLPNTSDLFGLEFDMDRTFSNEYKGAEVINTGRTSVNCNLVYQRKILLLWGGNVNINALYGLPMYETVNGLQLGEAYHASAALQWQTKF